MRCPPALCQRFVLRAISESTRMPMNRKVTELVPGPRFQSLYETRAGAGPEKIFPTEKIRLADGSNYISHVHLFPLEGFGGSLLVGATPSIYRHIPVANGSAGSERTAGEPGQCSV